MPSVALHVVESTFARGFESYLRSHSCLGLTGNPKTLLLPTASQRLVALDQGQQFIEAGLGQVEFGGKVICLICQHLQIAGGIACADARRAGGSFGVSCSWAWSDFFRPRALELPTLQLSVT